MLRVLGNDGMRYNPDKRADDAPFFTEDVFLHGIIQGGGGTFSSLPVLYAAVGRRVGWPIRLVSTKCHRFARWEDDEERFNIEITNQIDSYPDDYYRQGRYAHPPEKAEYHGWMRSETAREELARFLVDRACRALETGLYRQGTEARRPFHCPITSPARTMGNGPGKCDQNVTVVAHVTPTRVQRGSMAGSP